MDEELKREFVENCRGFVWTRAIIDYCHEHCDCCMETGCREHPSHASWSEGYAVMVRNADHEPYPLFLCPDCFETYCVEFDFKVSDEGPVKASEVGQQLEPISVDWKDN